MKAKKIPTIKKGETHLHEFVELFVPKNIKMAGVKY